MIYQELADALAKLLPERKTPVLVHTSLSSFGRVQGGAEAVLGALLERFETVVMPTFTYKTMVVPEVGPPNNAVSYGNWADTNRMAEFYDPEMPADKLMGIVAETLRQHPQVKRSMHPIMSFVGINADEYLDSQTLDNPLAPIEKMINAGGVVILLGVPHTSNTSIHLGERLAGRKTFVRWALTAEGVVACSGYPPCSDGFESIDMHLVPVMKQAQVGDALVRVVLIQDLVAKVQKIIEHDPFALMCDKFYCERCTAVRELVKVTVSI